MEIGNGGGERGGWRRLSSGEDSYIYQGGRLWGLLSRFGNVSQRLRDNNESVKGRSKGRNLDLEQRSRPILTMDATSDNLNSDASSPRSI